MRGEIGEAEKKGRTKQEVSKIEAETAVLDTRRRGDKAQADAELTNRQTELNMGIELAKIKASRQAQARDAELQKSVEQKKAETELERLRALDVTKAKIARETAQQKADAVYYTDAKHADSTFYTAAKQADGHVYTQRQDGEAFYAKQVKQADANLYARRAEAEGIAALSKAYKGMAEVMGGPQGLLQYIMLQKDTYEKLAYANAQAINGLQPKITVWNTGGDGSGSGAADPAAPIRNIFQTLPPLLSTVADQTGIQPPNWLVGSMGNGVPPEQQANSVSAAASSSRDAVKAKRLSIGSS